MMEDSDVIDGVIAIIDRPDPHHPSTRHGRPVVNVSTIAFPVPFPTVAIDNLALGRLAAEHLVVQGYRHFAYHMESRVYFSKQRGLGFGETLKDKGREVHFFDTGLHISAAPRELHALSMEWLRKLPKPLGLFTHNDQRAVVLMDLCRDAGLKVPEEVGIIGVDNDPLLAELCRPMLTSVDPGATTVGFRAAEMIAQILSGHTPESQPILLPPKRSTCGNPRSRVIWWMTASRQRCDTSKSIGRSRSMCRIFWKRCPHRDDRWSVCFKPTWADHLPRRFAACRLTILNGC
jgi:LacI family transcriptional regulator